jgi:hypothetical protein
LIKPFALVAAGVKSGDCNPIATGEPMVLADLQFVTDNEAHNLAGAPSWQPIPTP